MHLADRHIIAFARGESSSRRRRRTVAHLQRCPACRARLARMGEVRDAVREATNVTAPDRFHEVLARLDAGEVVILPTAAHAPPPPWIARRAAAVALALGISAAGAVAAVGILGPGSGPPGDVAPTAAPALRPPVAGLATLLTSDSFVVRIAPPSGPTTVRVGLASGDVVEVTGVDAASRSRFQTTADGILVSETTGGELRVSVPSSATRVLVRHGDALLVEVVDGRFRIHTHARLLGDSAVFVDLGPGSAPDTTHGDSR